MTSLYDILLPYQKKIASSNSRKKLICSSRQIGKSFLISYEAVKKSLLKDKSLSILVSTGQRAANELLKKVLRFAEAARLATEGKVTYTSNAECVTFSNGSRIMSLPNSPEACRGWTVTGVLCLDEAAFIMNADEIYQSLTPTMTRCKDAELIISSTPGGCSGLFYDLWTNDDTSWQKFYITIHDAVKDGLKVNVDELKSLCGDDQIFAQEYECQFSKSSGAAIDTNLLKFETKDVSKMKRILGQDVGRTHDGSAIADLRTDGSIFFLNDIKVLHDTAYSQQLAFVKQLDCQQRFDGGFIDGTGIGSAYSEQINEEVNSYIEGLQITAANKTPMFEYFRSLVMDKKLFIAPHLKDMLIEDIRLYQRIVDDAGRVRFSAIRANGSHGDAVFAIVLALWYCHEHPIKQTYVDSYHAPMRTMTGFASRLR